MNLHTARLDIRPVVPTDARAIHELCTHRTIRRAIFDDQIPPIAFVEHEIAHAQRLFQTKQLGIWTIRPASEAHIMGVVGLNSGQGIHTPQLVAIIDPACWQMGYGKEACVALWQQIKKTQLSTTVHNKIKPHNTQAIALSEAMGMHLRGLIDIQQSPHLHYACTV